MKHELSAIGNLHSLMLFRSMYTYFAQGEVYAFNSDHPPPLQLSTSRQLPSPYSQDPDSLIQNVQVVLTKWKNVLRSYLSDIDDQIEVILKFEEMCSESAKEFAPLFTRILHFMYDEDIVEEDAILSWDDEKRDADDSDKVFVKQAQKLIQWLREAPEEDDEQEE